MHTHIALLRGINVGGKHRLAMKDLVALLEALNLANVRTYIQSGNVVFDTPRKPAKALAGRISAAIEEAHGFRPRIMLLPAARLHDILDANPFTDATGDPKSLHVYLLEGAPMKPDLDAMEAIRTATERYHLEGDVLYLHVPDGMGRSKLAAKIEACLGVHATARNWRTMCTLREMVQAG
jgi:uncharacterized protein (DUF1697 family)